MMSSVIAYTATDLSTQPDHPQALLTTTIISDLAIMAAVKPGQRIFLVDLPVEVFLDNILPFESILGVLRLGCTNKVR